MHLQEKVAPTNFVPGDWAYFLNTDAKSYQQPGYEGSNAVYLGGNKFDDYYNDNHHHHYTYHEKMEEVYQWRHGVFRRRRDAAKREVMAKNTFERLGKTPEEGGLLLAYRAVPLLFTLETPLQLERGVRESITKE
ncbi:MAG: hypothetical protein Q7S87_00890 [Agitococcus sp.]|nr:hypothetical protein [Agitococcus sp.]